MIVLPVAYAHQLILILSMEFQSGPFTKMLFGGALDKIYEMDVKNRKWDGNIPQVLLVLCEGFVRLGGCQTEGVFRLAASATAIAAAKVNLERDDYSLSGVDDPHILACLLKRWFSDLLEPVIPTNF